jgi:hypothetical protein
MTGNTDVIKMVLHELVAVETRVDLGFALEALDHGFEKKRHKAELDAVFGLETFLHIGAQFHHGGHVALVEGGEDGGVALGGDQLGGNLFAEGRELFAGDATFLGLEFNGRSGGRLRCRGGCRRGRDRLGSDRRRGPS